VVLNVMLFMFVISYAPVSTFWIAGKVDIRPDYQYQRTLLVLRFRYSGTSLGPIVPVGPVYPVGPVGPPGVPAEPAGPVGPVLPKPTEFLRAKSVISTSAGISAGVDCGE
jgi:hypothetical protein